MTSSERYPGGGLRRAWPLAVSLAAHVVLVLAWLHFGKTERLVDEAPRTLSVLLLPKAAPTPPAITQPDKKVATSSRRPPPAAARALPATPVVPSLPAQPVLALPAPAPAAAPSALDILDAARQDIRKNGVGARGGKPGAPLQADGKWNRFADRLAGARVDDSRGPVTESYVSPDGQVMYRTRSNGKVACRKTGSTGPPAPWRSEEAIRAGAGSMATLGVANSAGGTLCSEGKRDWVRN
jgi:hypothetical protein